MEMRLCWFSVFLLVSLLCLPSSSLGKKSKAKPEWAKKNILDYNEADMERLLDQWEVR